MISPINPLKDTPTKSKSSKRMWLLYGFAIHTKFDYNGGAPVRSIWGFYNTKTKCYQSPINSSKQGDTVEIDNTRPYTAMPLKLNPLEAAFV
jgi:hypothetical protein